MDNVNQTGISEKVKLFVNQGQDLGSIEASLSQEGFDRLTISDIIREVKRKRSSMRTWNGSKLVIIGAILMLAGFISCVFLHYNNGPLGMSL